MNEETSLVPLGVNAPVFRASLSGTQPQLLQSAGHQAAYAHEEFILGHCRNPNTRMAYARAIRRFLVWIEHRVSHLAEITPGMVANYIDNIPGKPPTRKLHLTALRQWMQVLVERHVMVVNPAHSVRSEKYVIAEGEGLTPEITIEQTRTLLRQCQGNSLIAVRDRAILCTLVYSGARAGAVAKLKISSLVFDGVQYSLKMQEKGGKIRNIPVRSDLQTALLDYMVTAGLQGDRKDEPLFRTFSRTQNQLCLSSRAMTGHDIYRMMKRRLQDAGLPRHLVPHSIRACVVTDLLHQGMALEDVQTLVGHADPRTTRLYDRRKRQVSRNLVERISV